MPKPVILAFIIESFLVMVTVALLVQPESVFRGQTERIRSALRAGGYVFLCLTFCWSVVFGAVLTLNSMTLGF